MVRVIPASVFYSIAKELFKLFCIFSKDIAKIKVASFLTV